MSLFFCHGGATLQTQKQARKGKKRQLPAPARYHPRRVRHARLQPWISADGFINHLLSAFQTCNLFRDNPSTPQLPLPAPLSRTPAKNEPPCASACAGSFLGRLFPSREFIVFFRERTICSLKIISCLLRRRHRPISIQTTGSHAGPPPFRVSTSKTLFRPEPAD